MAEEEREEPHPHQPPPHPDTHYAVNGYLIGVIVLIMGAVAVVCLVILTAEAVRDPCSRCYTPQAMLGWK
jgi:hypothetical protein